ncbi:MAG: cupin domain-containing protein [Candidatus Sulfotelmatobacter sp.]
MTKQSIAVFFVCVVLAMSSLAQTPPAKKKSAGAAGGGGTMPGTETWMDIPAAAMVGTPSVEIGGTLKLAILQGDPMTAGRSYVVRLSCTDSAEIAPHWHPTTENVTVIKGGFLLGMGSKWDSASMKEFPMGAFVSAPPQMRHYAQCKGDSVLQINGIAPLVINFVGPDEAPAAKKTN